jgi:hypothetical protein
MTSPCSSGEEAKAALLLRSEGFDFLLKCFRVIPLIQVIELIGFAILELLLKAVDARIDSVEPAGASYTNFDVLNFFVHCSGSSVDTETKKLTDKE